MKKSLLLLAASVLAIGTATPSYAADDTLGQVGSFFGAVTATLVDIPQGIVVESLWRTPKRTWHYLAEKFGDENGVGQNLAGAAIGVPAGFVMGIPYGAVHGGQHGWRTGWDKPFSSESYLVPEESD